MKKYIEIISDDGALSKAEKFLIDFRNEFLPNIDDKFFQILIAYTEAVNNAIHHGNKCDKSKKVGIELFIDSQNLLTVIVQDEGKGFSIKNLANPTAPENLNKESGRGVFLIKKLTFNVDYNISNSGTKVIMSFKI